MPGTARIPAARLSDEELERRLSTLVAAESDATADIVEHVAEFERRRLFAPKSLPSMFEYCTRTLGYSEGAAYLRIYAGRLSIEYPEILELLRTRRVHLTAIRTVGPHLKPWNSRQLLARTSSKTERELKFLIAETAPKPEPREVIRRLTSADMPNQAPTSAPEFCPEAQTEPRVEASSEPRTETPSEPCVEKPPEPRVEKPPEPRAEKPPEPRAEKPPEPRVDASSEPRAQASSEPGSPLKSRIEPLSAHRVRFAFTGTDEFLKRFERARELLRHQFPAGSLEDVFRESIEAFLDARDPARKTSASRPRASNPRGRKVPWWVKDVVFKRDDGRCAFLSVEGVRCEERGGLEYDHIVPWAKGGLSNDPTNIRLLCRTHNILEAERSFGRTAMTRRSSRGRRGP